MFAPPTGLVDVVFKLAAIQKVCHLGNQELRLAWSIGFAHAVPVNKTFHSRQLKSHCGHDGQEGDRLEFLVLQFRWCDHLFLATHGPCPVEQKRVRDVSTAAYRFFRLVVLTWRAKLIDSSLGKRYQRGAPPLLGRFRDRRTHVQQGATPNNVVSRAAVGSRKIDYFVCTTVVPHVRSLEPAAKNSSTEQT